MARLDILHGSIKGSVGQVTGSVWKGKPTIRARIFSKAPPQELQTSSLRAFEKLNRISAAIAREGFDHLGISSTGLHKHNAVARWLKPTVSHNTFNPANISQVIPSADNARAVSFFHDRPSGRTTLSIRIVAGFTPNTAQYLHAIVFDDDAQVYLSFCGQLKNYDFDFFIDSIQPQVFSVLFFYTEPLRHKRIANNFFYKRGNIMRYSANEQLTGDYWIDGKPIYVQTITINYSNLTAGSNNISLPTLTGIQVVLNAIITNRGNSFSGGNAYVGQFPQPIVSATSPFVTSNLMITAVAVSQINGNVFLSFATATAVSGGSLIVTVYYTKTSDQPVVDG